MGTRVGCCCFREDGCLQVFYLGNACQRIIRLVKLVQREMGPELKSLQLVENKRYTDPSWEEDDDFNQHSKRIVMLSSILSLFKLSPEC